jgi:hypothetical protein
VSFVVVFPFCVGSMELNLQVYHEVIITRGVSHYGLAIYIKSYHLKAKRRIMKTQIFHHEINKYNLPKLL